MSVTELGKRLGVSQQAASKQVADLQSRSLVARIPNSDDARSTLVTLTPRAHRAIGAARSSRQRITEELTASLGSTYVADLAFALTELSDHTDVLGRLLRREHRPDAAR